MFRPSLVSPERRVFCLSTILTFVAPSSLATRLLKPLKDVFVKFPVLLRFSHEDAGYWIETSLLFCSGLL